MFFRDRIPGLLLALLQQIAEANYELLVMAGEKPAAVNVCAPAKPPTKPPAPIQKQ